VKDGGYGGIYVSESFVMEDMVLRPESLTKPNAAIPSVSKASTRG